MILVNVQRWLSAGARYLCVKSRLDPIPLYNKETLGFRLDTKREIGIFRDGAEPQHVKIDDFFEYIKALIGTVIDAQGNMHLHSDDWQRTVYIDTLGVRSTDFDISNAKKNQLRQSGKKGASDYFDWYDKTLEPSFNNPDYEPD